MQSSPQKKRESGVFREIWKAYNDLLEYTRSVAVLQSGNRGVRVSRTANGTLLAIEQAKAEEAVLTVARFKIKSVGNNSYSCVEWDGTTEGSTVEIAKPWKLRSSPFNGRTIGGYTYSYTGATTRVKSTATESENQEIIPTYDLDFDEIYAVQIEGETGVSGVDWIDLNLDGRAWAKV